MKKNKLYIILAILTTVFLFTVSAVCNQCKVAAPEEEAETGEEEQEEVAEEAATEEEAVEEEEEEATAEEEEEVAEEEEEEEATEEEKEAPTISLSIYEGPTYSPDDNVCYYRIKATVTGSPSPTVEWSKDDSGGAWGTKKAQVNLNDPSETYTLTATATNSEGSDTDSIPLSWGCEEGIEEEEAEEESVFEGRNLEHLLERYIFTLDKVILHPKDIGYLVWPSGVNTETAIFGDSISDQYVQGFFGFGDLSELAGREIESVSLRLNTYKFWGNPLPEFDIQVVLERRLAIFPLSPEVWIGEVGIEKLFPYNQEPLVWSGNDLKNEILARINDGRKIEFRLFYYPNYVSDEDGETDGREYRKEDIALTIEFAD